MTAAGFATIGDRFVDQVFARLTDTRGADAVRQGAISRATIARACRTVLHSAASSGPEPSEAMIGMLADAVEGRLNKTAGARA